MALVCVLRSGSWAICCIATGLLDKSTVHILPTIVLAYDKIYMATQYILGLDRPRQGEILFADLPEGVALDQYPGNTLSTAEGRTLSSTSSMWMGRIQQAQGLAPQDE